MTKVKVLPTKTGQLRQRAEKVLKQSTQAIKGKSPKDIQKLIEELNIHQIELEMQNEELRKAQIELEESRQRYSDLYDFAPVGYFILDKNGMIIAANLTGAKAPKDIDTILFGLQYQI